MLNKNLLFALMSLAGTVTTNYAIDPKANDSEFVILITSYNNEKWAEDNLKSVCFQESSKPYHVICVNDCSKDKTGKIMDDFVSRNNLQSKVTVIHNKERVGALENIYNAVHSVEDHKVIVSVDGDDTLYNNSVLLTLEKAYRDPDVWMTYGSQLPVYEYLANGLADEVFYKKQIRKAPFVTSHLRTFKAGLFKKIKKEDLLYKGKFFEMTWDFAIMFPMLEMCSPKNPKGKIRAKHVKDILYVYRTDNPLSDNRVNKPLQLFLDEYIRTLKPYAPIDSL